MSQASADNQEQEAQKAKPNTNQSSRYTLQVSISRLLVS